MAGRCLVHRSGDNELLISLFSVLSHPCVSILGRNEALLQLYYFKGKKNVRHPGNQDLRTWKAHGLLQILTLLGGRRTYCLLSGVLGTCHGTHRSVVETQKWPPYVPLRSGNLRHPWTSPHLCAWLGEECLNRDAGLGAL